MIYEVKDHLAQTHKFDKDLFRVYRLKLPKRSGGFRTVYAPSTELKRAQRFVCKELTPLVKHLPLELTAYRKYNSAYTNAKKHFDKLVTIKFDIKDYFGSLKWWQINDRVPKPIAHRLSELGYSFAADIGTLPGSIQLYQGSCLSPLFANLYASSWLVPKLKRLAGRYALPIFIYEDCEFIFDPVAKAAHVFSTDIPAALQRLPQIVYHDTDLSKKDKCVLASHIWLSTRKANIHIAVCEWAKDALNFRSVNAKVHPYGKTAFTLYSDDGVFSGNNIYLNQIKSGIAKILSATGLNLNMKKGITVLRGKGTVTGYSTGNAAENAFGARIPYTEIDKSYRRPLHHLKIGKLQPTKEVVEHLIGKISYLRLSNKEQAEKYGQQLQELLPTLTSDETILALLKRLPCVR
jgi:hypothetical protein